MLDRVVAYLRTHGVPFRLSSHPSPEPLPAVAHCVPPGGLAVETQVLVVGGQPAIACLPRGERLSLPELRHELRAEVIEGSPADLKPPYSQAGGQIPPLGGAMGALTLIDERLTSASAIVFTAFSPNDCIELSYDEFARLERPRVASFTTGGELPEHAEPQEPNKKVA